MLCICFICNYGYSALDVEPFKHTKTNKKIFLCKTHIENKPTDYVQLNWSSDTLICKKCEPTKIETTINT